MDPQGSDARILVIDDQVVNLELLVRLLRRAGYAAVEGTTDARDGLRRIEEREPDLLLLDLHMPNLDGFAVLEELRRRPTSAFLPVIVLTGDIDRAARSRALQLGATDFLTKPYDVDEVVLRCRNLLEMRRLHRELADQNLELRDEVVDRTERLEAVRNERAALAEAFARLQHPGPPEATASAVCAEVLRVTGLRQAVLVVFRADGAAICLGAAGDAIGPGMVLRSLPEDDARRLRERSGGGPWIEERSTLLGTRLPAAERPRVDLHAPLRSGGRVAGVLAAGIEQPVDLALMAERLPSVMQFAAVAGALLAPALVVNRSDGLHAIIAGIVESHALQAVYQPIVDLVSGRVLGYEALTRFPDGVPPDRRLADAASVGLGVELELECVRTALAGSSALPPDAWLSLNVSPDTVLATDRLAAVLDAPARDLVLEVTEHVAVNDYAGLRAARDALRPAVRIAIDDAGAGYASFRHILELQPDFVKLDIALVRSIESDRARQALVAGMDYFAERTGCALIAEGIETPAERDALRSLSVQLGQGYLLGRPAPMH